MGWAANGAPWTDDMDAELCRLFADGATGGVIGAALGVSRNAAQGRINRLRAAGDARLPAAGPSPIRTASVTVGLAPIDALAEVMASDGCASVDAAARRLRISVIEARGLWGKIRRGLGAQAA